MFRRAADWFYMTPRERVGSAVLMVVLLLVILTKFALSFWESKRIDMDAKEVLHAISHQSNSTPTTVSESSPKSVNATHKNTTDTVVLAKTFYRFNPNTESEEGLRSLGLSKLLSGRVVNYRTSGGVFYRPEDVLRIYDMDSLWWIEAKRFMTFSHEKMDLPSAPMVKRVRFDPNTVSLENARKLGISDWQFEQLEQHRQHTPIQQATDLNVVYGLDPYLVAQLAPYVSIDSEFEGEADLNTADTTRLKQLRGIGSYYAKQIVGLREQLGVLPSHEVLWSIPGIDSARWLSIYSQTECETNTFIPLAINHAGEEELSKHPFITRAFAKEIVGFRENFRPFVSVDELERLSLFPRKRKYAVLPYLTTD